MKQLRSLFFGLACCLMVATSLTSYGQGNDPVSIDRYRKGIDSEKTLVAQWSHQHKPDTLKGVKGIGYKTQNTRTSKIVSYIGVGVNNAGELNLSDSIGNNYLKIKDTLNEWYFNSYRKIAYNIRGVEAMNIDTGNLRVTIDSTAQVKGRIYQGTSGVFYSSGTGSPETVVTAPIGSLYLRTDGSTSTTLYVKTSGSSNTGWTAK